MAASELESALRGYLDARADGTEAFVWRKVAAPTGPEPPRAGDGGVTGTDGAADVADKAPAAPGRGAIACGGGYGARLTVEFLDDGGNAVSSSSVEVRGLPDPSSCDLSDRASVEGFVGDLERGLMPAIDRAGRLLGEAALAASKKN